MPRLAEDTQTLLADLTARLSRVVAAAQNEGREAALSDVRGLIGGAAPAKRGRPLGSKNKPKAAAVTKSGRKRKNSWSALTPAQKLARVNAIRKGRGLAPKGA